MSRNKAAAAAQIPDAADQNTISLPLEAAVGDFMTAERENVVTLELADLVRDSNGEIVLFNDSHLPALAVRADSRLVESGEVGSHVTAAGDDVTGYRFVAFDNGTKLFYQDSMDLVILGGNGEGHA